MPPSRVPLALALAALAFTVAVLGFTVVGADEDARNGEAVLERTSSYDERLEGVTGTRVVERSVENRERIWRERIRQRSLDGPPGADEPGPNGSGVGEVVVVEEGALTAPFLDQEPVDDVLLEEAIRGDVEVEYVGTDTVADRRAHVVELTPIGDERSVSLLVGDTEYVVPLGGGDAADAYTFESMTLWVDAEYYFPLKRQTTTEIDGETVVSTTRFVEVDYEERSDDGGDGDGGEGTNESDGGDEGTEVERTTYQDPDAAADELPFALPEPSIPEGYALDEVVVHEYEDGDRGVTLTYADDSGRQLWIVVTQRPLVVTDRPVAENVGSVDGDLYQRPRAWALDWDCESADLHYRVAGNEEKDALVAVAESVGCGA